MQRILFFVTSALATGLLSTTPAYAHISGGKEVSGDEFVQTDRASLYNRKLSHDEAEAQLADDGIYLYSSGGCTDRYNSSCTSVEQINDTTVNTLIVLHQASGCWMVVTGGTEAGHAGGTYTHWNGYKVDISKTDCIDNYIEWNFNYIGRRGDGAYLYQSPAGNLYADEYWASHWDITYY